MHLIIVDISTTHDWINSLSRCYKGSASNTLLPNFPIFFAKIMLTNFRPHPQIPVLRKIRNDDPNKNNQKRENGCTVYCVVYCNRSNSILVVLILSLCLCCTLSSCPSALMWSSKLAVAATLCHVDVVTLTRVTRLRLA